MKIKTSKQQVKKPENNNSERVKRLTQIAIGGALGLAVGGAMYHALKPPSDRGEINWDGLIGTSNNVSANNIPYYLL